MEQKPYFYKLSPFIVHKLWGGHHLAKLKNLKTNELVGETWEVSTLKEGQSQVQGTNLSQLTNELKYLIKYINTTDYLSVQVHPGDEYAKTVEQSSGKTECWFVLDAEENAGIYLGFKPTVTKEIFSQAIDKKENLSNYLEFYPAKRGDFFFVPAGSIHAIGKGITIAEVQQSSGITYRVWDWDRLDTDGKPRKLDVKKALDVLIFDQAKNSKEYFNYKRDSFKNSQLGFIDHSDFKLDLIVLDQTKMELNLDSKKTYSILNIEGEGEVSINNQTQKIHPYETFLIAPKTEGQCVFSSNHHAVFLLVR